MSEAVTPEFKTPEPKELATLTMQFLDRIDLNAKEVPAFVQVQMWLARLIEPAPAEEPASE